MLVKYIHVYIAAHPVPIVIKNIFVTDHSQSKGIAGFHENEGKYLSLKV